MNKNIAVRGIKGLTAAGCLVGAYVFGFFIVKLGPHPLTVGVFSGLAIGGAILGKQAITGYKEEQNEH